MPGSHSVNFTEGVKITAPAQLNLIGLDVNVTANANRSCNDSEVDCGFFFEGHSRDKHIDISIKNLTFYNVSIKLNNASITMDNYYNLYQSLLNINHSNVSFTGVTTFADSHVFTIYAYYGNITLSGDITFANNTAVGGGAMYLQFHSYTLQTIPL